MRITLSDISFAEKIHGVTLIRDVSCKKKPIIYILALRKLTPIYEMYTSRQMLQRMVPDMNSNNIENTNSVIWNILGKSKYHGTRRTKIGVILAIAQVEDGKKGLVGLLDTISIRISKDAENYLHIADIVCANLLSKRNNENKDHYMRRLQEAVLQVEAREHQS